MMASLFSGVSGLKNHQVKMNVIGNNIANINTIGFKTSRVNFQEALVQTLQGAGRPSSVLGGTNPVQLGLGMEVSSIDTLFQQGGLETTGQITDLAIQGEGFFVLGDLNDNRFYTRAGAFGFDANTNLVDPATGLFVLGKMADEQGIIPSLATTGPITIPFGQQDPAQATTIITLANNLNASATESVADLLQAGSSNVNGVSGIAEDGVGGTHVITITGAQAQAASVTSIAGLSLNQTLDDPALNVNDFTNFSITIDNTRTEPIVGLTGSSTIADLIYAINLIAGLTAEFDSTTGSIVITRDMAGSPSEYGFESSVSVNNGLDRNIVAGVFGIPDGLTFVSSGGAATTYVATDTFTPLVGSGAATGPFISLLDLVIDDQTGLVVGLDNFGGGGVEITTFAGGLMPTAVGQELIIETAPTTHSMSIAVFDSLGEKHILSIEFFKSALDNRWEWGASTLGTETISSGSTGYVQFNPDGSLNTFEYNGGAQSIVMDPDNGALSLSIEVDAGTVNTYDGLTGFSSGSHTASIIGQDGYGLGILEKISIDQTGNISGFFSNGVTRILAQIILADFSNEAGLRKVGRSMYQESANSGEPVEGVAGATIAGTLSSGALESSSVDIAQEFTSMITAQRGFQANARIITTSDNMLDDLVNIKR
ncbi:MAG: flagellar hook-basal body complex protein [Candidatus Zixiibacteriota bacterium]|nr:MAG: flagellar hook-basal body complex protein [candidate division Zixibacteria bacterium]